MSTASGINIGKVSGDFSLQAGGDIVAGNKTVINNLIQRLTKQLATSPYKFLASYDIADRDIFYGRNTIVEELAGAVSRHKVIIINGASGAGKSSLVNAGIIPRLADNGYTYVSFREYSDPLAQFSNLGNLTIISPSAAVEAAASDGSATLVSQGARVVASRSESGEAKPPDFNNPSSLLELIRGKKSIPMVVVLDQFERFFINVSIERRNAFIAAFRHCVYNSTAKEVNFVIGLRSEFYGQLLAEFEPQMPEFLNEAYRFNLLPLTQSEARDAIVRPLENTGLKIQYDEDFVDKVLLVSLAAQAGGNSNVNPPHLQIVCNELFEAARQLLQQKSSVLIDEKLYNTLGGVQTILNTYLDKAVEEVARNPERIGLVRSVLQRMIDTTGTRRFVSLEILKRELPDVGASEIATIIAGLLDRRVIEDRSPTYSLSHEYMVPQVKGWFDPIEMERKRAQETLERGLAERKNSQALLNRPQVEAVHKWVTELNPEEQKLLQDSEIHFLKEEREEAEQERRLQASERARRRTLQIGFAVATTLAIVAFGFALSSHQEAKLAQARQLATQSDYLRTEETDGVEQSALLAIQSILLSPLVENDTALREALMLLPRQVATFVEGGWVEGVAFSPDGRFVATASNDSTARVFEVATGKEISRLQHDGMVAAVAFSPDGRYVATASDDRTARVFEAATGKELSRLTERGSVRAVAFSPDGRYVATASWDNTARVFEAATGKELSRLNEGEADAVSFSPNGRYVATGSADETARVFEAATGRELSRLTEGGQVNAVTFSPDGLYVATGSNDNTARVFEAATGKELSRITEGDQVKAVAFNPDGRFVATASWDKTARVFEAATGKELSRLTERDPVVAVAFSPDGRYVATASDDWTARVFEAATGKELSRLSEGNSVNAVAFSPNGHYVATGSNDKTARVFAPAIDTELFRRKEGGPVNTVSFSPNGRYVATGSDDDTARVFEAATGRELSRLTEGGPINAVAFSPDSHYVATGSDVAPGSDESAARVFQVASGKELSGLTEGDRVTAVALSSDGHHVATGSSWDDRAILHDLLRRFEFSLVGDQAIWAVALSPDGRYVATGDGDGTARVFGSVSGFELSRLAEDAIVDAVTFSPDGRYVATGSWDLTARVFETASGKELARLTEGDIVDAVTFSPNGRYVATGSHDKTVRVFEAASGKELLRLTEGGFVDAVAFTPDGRYILTGSIPTENSSEVIVTRELLRATDLISEACSRLTRNLTPDEWKQYRGDTPRQKTCPNLP